MSANARRTSAECQSHVDALWSTPQLSNISGTASPMRPTGCRDASWPAMATHVRSTSTSPRGVAAPRRAMTAPVCGSTTPAEIIETPTSMPITRSLPGWTWSSGVFVAPRRLMDKVSVKASPQLDTPDTRRRPISTSFADRSTEVKACRSASPVSRLRGDRGGTARTAWSPCATNSRAAGTRCGCRSPCPRPRTASPPASPPSRGTPAPGV